MKLHTVLLPLVLSAAVVVGCDKKEKDNSAAPNNAQTQKQTPAADATKATPAVSDAEKAAADAKAAADKKAAEEKAAADKAAADAKAAADKQAADMKAAAEKAAADTEAKGKQLLGNLQTAITSAKWTDADSLIKQLDAIKDKLPQAMQDKFESLKKLYTDNKSKLQSIPGLGGGQ